MTQEELLRLIDEAAADGRTTLDLSGQQLYELPPEIGKLTNLKTLVLGRWDKKESKAIGNYLKDLPDEIRHLRELRSLFLCGNQFSVLPDVVQELSELRSLNLERNQLESLPNFFGNLSRLRVVDLDKNHLSELPECLSKLTNLIKLNLNSNQLSEVPGFLCTLGNLTELNLGSNQFSEVPKCLGQLTKLTRLNLHSNQLTGVPASLSKLTNLTELYLWGNQFSKVSECLSKLTNLTELNLSSNQLTEVPEFLGHLTSLNKLYFHNNQLSEVPDCLSRLTNLTELVLSSNQLSEIPEYLGSLTNLNGLSLHSNQLTEVPECLSHLTSLTKLSLHSNQLTEAPKCLSHLTNLSELYLSSNQLSDVPECLSKLTNLTKLSLHNNQLTEVPECLSRLTNLSELDLSSNQLSEIPRFLSQLTNLNGLSLGGNQLSEVPDCLGSLSNLTELYLWKNQLSEVPEFVGQLTNLTKLDLGNNQLSKVPECLSKLINLTNLYLSSNQLSDVPECLSNLANITELYLGSNQLTEVPGCVSQLTNLTKLVLHSNQLAEIPEFLSQLTNLTKLYLWGNQLSEVPECLSKLTNLTGLYLSRNQLTEVPKCVSQLTNLSELDLSRNQLTEVPGCVSQLTNLTKLVLHSNQLAEIPEFLSQLTNLTKLYLWGNQLSEVPECLSKLTNLTGLYLSRNQLTEVPKCVSQLTNLTQLVLHSNQLTEVPEFMRQLTNLTKLNLRSNQLAEVPEFLGDLRSLTELNLWGNRLSKPPLCVQSLPNLEKLDVRANQLPISPELLGSKRRTETPPPPSDLIRLFQAQQENQSEPLYEAKLLIVGEGETGKTTLAKKLLNARYKLDTKEHSTEGIDISNFSFDHTSAHTCRVNVWDFGGQEIYHATHQFFLTERSVYVLVVDSRRENPNFYFWLNVIQLHGGEDSPILIIKNEKQDRLCNVNDLQLRGKFQNLRESVQTNLATNRGLETVKSTIERYISALPGLGQDFPSDWLKIRNALENLTLGNEFYIDIKEYRKICCRYGVHDRNEQNSLSRILHNLGIFLHFQDIHALEKTLFLKPSWCTAAVYKVLDTDSVRKDCGRFNKEDLDKIWSDAQYADVRGELLSLMKEFEVCYEINGYKDHFIAPHLLSANLPEEDNYSWNEENNLILTYLYTFKPKNIFPRFIVAMHKYIERQRAVWKHGVVLSILSARAEVIEDVGYERSGIRIRVSGTDKKRLISVIQDHLDRIHDSFERLDVEVLVPCNCSECKGSQDPYTFPHQTLLKSIEKRNYEVQCLQSFESVNVRRLIDNVFEPTSQPFDYKKTIERHQDFNGRMGGRLGLRSEIEPSDSETESVYGNKIALTFNLPEQRYDQSESITVTGNVENSQLAVGNENTLSQQNTLDAESTQLIQDLIALIEEYSDEYNPTKEKGQAKIKDAILSEIQQQPTLKTRCIKALKAAGEQTLIEMLNHPAAKVVVKGIKGFVEG